MLNLIADNGEGFWIGRLWCFVSATGFAVQWVRLWGVFGIGFICVFLWFGAYLFFIVFSVGKSKV